MATSIFAYADWLRVENNKGYGVLPIPRGRDVEISSLLRAWLDLDEPSRKTALSQLPSDCRFTLLGYSERMASLAVRHRNKEHILLGLLALGLDGWRADWRDNVLVVCLHYDAAKRIGLRQTIYLSRLRRSFRKSPQLHCAHSCDVPRKISRWKPWAMQWLLTPTDSVTRGRGKPLVRRRGSCPIFLSPVYSQAFFCRNLGSYCGLTVKSIDDWPTLWPNVSSIVICKV